jgi:small subunit ribosomal protein S6
MRQYETIFVVHPNLSEEEYKEVLKRFTTLMERAKGILVKVDEWGIQRLAHRVGKSDRGYYVLMNYCGEPGVTAELERDLKLDERVLNFQSVKLSDEADPEELIRKETEGQKKETPAAAAPPAPEAPAPVEGPAAEPVKEVKSDV